nr:PAS domain-containing protein [Chitinophagaceae bacterium]
MANLQSHHIIAIGSSAGGMDEINRFFDHTPIDGVAYIIIQHLSPDYKSRIVELLAKHSKLKVKEAEDEMLVEANHVYVIPGKKFMTISNSRLHLADKGKTAGPHLTINTFFNSLASEREERAIGIIFSGLGSDGTEGIKAIKKAGGMVIARDPALSEFTSMPANAIATGVVDYILEPELMPGVIEYYVKNDGALLPHALESNGEEKIIVAIINLIKDRLPLDFSDYKQTTILRRIKRRAANQNFINLETYLAFLKSNNDEVEALAKDFLISVTSFFRDKEAFRYIQKHVIPKIIKQHKTGEDIKVWVPGCATGEEAYSLAILLKEQLNGDYKNLPVKIFATDIDTAALTYAGIGLYTEIITKYVSPERLEKFFLKEGNKYRILPEIRKMLIFAQHDLVKSPAYSNMDLISCRNLLIYMTPPLQKKILHMLHFGLKKNGYLFMGSSENAEAIPGLELVNENWRIYKNLEKKQRARLNTFILPALTDPGKNSGNTLPGDNYQNKKINLADAVNEALITELGYLLVCVDEKNNVLKTSGDATKYLLQKNFNANLGELLPKPLAVAFNKASREALQSNKKVQIKGIKINNNQSTNTVKLFVQPLAIKKAEQKILMVLFCDDTQSPLQTEGEVFDEKMFINQYTQNLEEELIAVKDELHSTLEKLDASNENMQSFNEELLAANEEMQNTNEEMQSINEELHTINTDYEEKNKELIALNDELNNYFRSNINGQLYVNRDLLLIKFSPGTVKHINLLDTDIGRPITNISTNIKFETIESDIKEVINNGGVINKEIEATDGKW